MTRQLDVSTYRAVANHVVSTTASLSSGSAVVEVRPDDGFSDGILMTPRQARALARALVVYAARAARINRELRGRK